jgi:hypothetical protein
MGTDDGVLQEKLKDLIAPLCCLWDSVSKATEAGSYVLFP